MIRFKVKDHSSISMKVEGNSAVSMTVEKTTVSYVGSILYEGEYEVTPTVEGKTLQTAQKTMLNDLVIKKIPYAEVKNHADGITVTIAD